MITKKILLVFLFGCFSGVLIPLVIGILNIKLDSGWQLMQPKVFGNIRIIPEDIDPTCLPDLEYAVTVENNNSKLFSLFFDKNKVLREVVLLNHDNVLLTARLPFEVDNGRIEYGVFPTNSYWDIDINGIFDIHWRERQPYIFINNQWLKVDEYDGVKNALIKNDSKADTYLFEYKTGWKAIDP
jgi:hypothetical protein